MPLQDEITGDISPWGSNPQRERLSPQKSSAESAKKRIGHTLFSREKLKSSSLPPSEVFSPPSSITKKGGLALEAG